MTKQATSSKKLLPAVAPASISPLAAINPANLQLSDQPGKEEGDHLATLYRTAEHAQLCIIVLGLYAYGVKSKLPYGTFGLWLHNNAPELARQAPNKSWKPTAALNSYMQQAASVMEAMGIELKEWFPGLDSANKKLGMTTSTALKFQPHQLLLFSESELDPTQRALRAKVQDLLAGKNTSRAMITKFITVKDDDESATGIVPTTGAGKYHATKADGTPRAPKRTFQQKQEDEAAAAAAGLKATLQAWRTREGIERIKLLPAGLLLELRGLAKDLHAALQAD